MDNQEWLTFFNDHASAYDDNVFTKNTAAEIAFLLDLLGLPPGAAVLDVGCGTGRHSVALAQRGFAVTGLDLSPGMLAQARQRAEAAGVTVAWVQADATRFTFDKPFDAAICLCEGAFGLLSATDDPIQQPLAILKNIAAALKPAGPCVLTVLSALPMIRRATPERIATGTFDHSGSPKPPNSRSRTDPRASGCASAASPRPSSPCCSPPPASSCGTSGAAPPGTGVGGPSTRTRLRS